MFDLRSYILLLNEAFDTGNDNDDLYCLLEAFLDAENEPVRPVNTDSSELHRILNNNRVMHAFTRVTGGSVQLSTCFRQQVTQLGRVDFVLLEASGLMEWLPAPSVLRENVPRPRPGHVKALMMEACEVCG